jgi:predicted nucleic acid-binding protein
MVAEKAARERIALRDPDDWPVVATALLLDLPILDRGSGLLWQRCPDMDK